MKPDFSRNGYENTFKEKLRTGINLFCGAGFSVEAYDINHRTLPAGKALLDELKESFPVIDNYQSLSRACTKLIRSKKQEFYSNLTERFKVDSYNPLYKALYRIPVHNIYTTNIDDLFFRLYEADDSPVQLSDRTLVGASYKDRAADEIGYHPLHGCVRHEREDYVFGATEIASAFSLKGDILSWRELSRDASQQPLLFWGWNFDDPGPLEAMYGEGSQTNDNPYRWALLYEPSEETIDYLESLGINIIIGDTLGLLEYLADFDGVSENGAYSNSSLCSQVNDMAKYCPPVNDNKLVSFPLSDFYTSYSPRWSHIYSGDVPITSNYRRVADVIASGCNALVIGLRGCGKTTIMMQLAAYYETNLPKHILVSPTLSEVKSYIKRLDGRESLLFIDDCFRDTDAVLYALKCKSIQVICFDRDYSYEGQVNKLDSSLYEIVDVTEITVEDAQAIVNSIPDDLKRRNASTKHYKVGYSILDFLASCLEASNFNFLTSFYEKDSLAAKVFLMIAYVHSCGTPCSNEMIASFLGGEGYSYQRALEVVDHMGALVEELSEEGYGRYDVKWELDDYYQCRSRFLAERVLESIPFSKKDDSEAKTLQGLFAEVLFDFAENVMPYRICMYDRFKRKGYDAEYAYKAFKNPEEGRDYYLLCVERDESEYVYQQAALYFNRLGDHRTAFEWIDRARNQSKNFGHYNHFIIDATFAQISFEANVKVDREQAERALDLLGQCCERDRRKATHYARYAEYCIRLCKTYKDIDYSNQVSNALRYVEMGLDNQSRSLGVYSRRNLEKQRRSLKAIARRLGMSE